MDYLMKLKSNGIEFQAPRCGRKIRETLFKFIEEEIEDDINFCSHRFAGCLHPFRNRS
jgi:hypothetical protein